MGEKIRKRGRGKREKSEMKRRGDLRKRSNRS
jgi:hypothetical protein